MTDHKKDTIANHLDDIFNNKANNQFKDNPLDQIFAEDQLNEAIKKGRRKSTKRTVLISVIVAVFVLVLFNVGNFLLTVHTSNKAFQKLDAYIRLTVPNGYISSKVDDFGFLGGLSDYTISRKVGGRPIVLENRVQPFGLVPQFIMTRGRGGGHSAGEWPTSYWEFGYNKMIFFHPEVPYKEYKNDLDHLRELSEGKIIEVALSFDRSYTISEISQILPNVNASWYWVDTYRSEEVQRYTTEAKEYDAKAAFIHESEALGVSVDTRGDRPYEGAFGFSYNNFLFDLKSYPQYQKIYDELDSKGYTDPSKAPLLGVIVQGSKEELSSLMGNPHIKASSFGAIIDKY
jgi:hypothetical protein